MEILFNGKNVDHTMTKKELLELAKELGIVGRHDMDKSTLIGKVRDALVATQVEEAAITSKDTGKENTKLTYIENAKLGLLVAFRVSETKVLSGIIEERDEEARTFLIRTKNGIKFTVRFKNILWVKTGPRWPRGIYLALRGETDVQGSGRD